MEEMFGVACSLCYTKERLTVVIDKEMNAEGNFSWIDENSRIRFITTHSMYFSQDLAATPLDRFDIIDLAKNERLIQEDRRDDCLRAFRTKGEYWGKERTVVLDRWQVEYQLPEQQ